MNDVKFIPGKGLFACRKIQQGEVFTMDILEYYKWKRWFRGPEEIMISCSKLKKKGDEVFLRS